MKGLITKVFAVLLLGCYLTGVIGFDVHTCNGTDRSFVVTFIEGMTCEDIHPEHSCGHHSCCPDHSHSSCCHHEQEHDDAESDPCCSNEYQALDLTGTLSQDDLRICAAESLFHVICPDMCSHYGMYQVLPSAEKNIRCIHGPDSGFTLPGDVQSYLGIWRI